MAKNFALMCGFLVIAALLAPVSSSPCFASEESHSSSEGADFPPDLQEYHDAGQSILKGHFDGGVSPVGLVRAAVVPTLIVFTMFMLFR